MAPFDPRITPARPDLAAAHLKGQVNAARFVEGVLREVVAPAAPVRWEPRPDSRLDTEALRGERVMVYETSEEGWAWGQLLGDGYVGWLPTEALREPGVEPTHRVVVPRTLVFPGPSIRLAPIDVLSFGCMLAVTHIEAHHFSALATGGFVPRIHLASTDFLEPDFVSVAERLIRVPYLWGGKTSLGLDCSALVQLGLLATGRRCPRDSDMQEQSLGTPIDPAGDVSNLTRGDLLFWDGHVAIVRDQSTLIHANGYHMAVAIEPAADAVARLREEGREITSVRRLQGLVQ
jgi:prepilin-type processing-associated H-X9-DG protein